MNVVISVPGIFHGFHVAEQLQKRGYLKKIITSHPYFKLKKRRNNVTKENIKSLPLSEIISRIPLPVSRSVKHHLFKANLFDWLAAFSMGDTDVFLGFPGYCLNSIRVAKRRGIITIVDADHISYPPELLQKIFGVTGVDPLAREVLQKEILEEEYAKFGMESPVDLRVVERELMEYNEADYILTPADFVHRSFISRGLFRPAKLRKIPYGVDLTEFRPMEKRDNIFRVLFVGGISIRKGIQYLLEAFKQLSLPNSELVIIGYAETGSEEILEKYRGIYRNIGKIDRHELYEYYSQASVFVLPSVLEGYGIVIGEAMACGIPVIATENTGAVEIVREGKDGFIVPIRDVDSLKSRLRYLYENERERQTMGQSAMKHIVNFTWDRYGEQLVETLKQIVAEHRKI